MRTRSILIIFALGAAVLFSCAGAARQGNSKPKDESSISKDDNSVKDDISFDTPPILVKKVTPKYPIVAKERGITATVWVKALVNSLGIVEKVEIVNENEKNVSLFAESVKNTAYYEDEWKPATKDGKPISVWVTYKIDFKLK